MMNQPELGKKIHELRKSKGYTQEEFVEMCKISVRTLQRIESGEVTPRKYTLNAIIKNLDFEDSLKADINELPFLKKLEQLKEYVFNLFNLKTKTMKKIAILTLAFCAIFLVSQAIDMGKEKNNTDDIDKINQTSNDAIVFNNFYCENCFEENDILIGHGVDFKTNGVRIKIDLIKINKITREFTCGIITGKISENSIEIYCPKQLVNDESVKLTADKINKQEDKIELIGNASINSEQGDIFEAVKIIISYN